jgi:hypothetical protein
VRQDQWKHFDHFFNRMHEDESAGLRTLTLVYQDIPSAKIVRRFVAMHNGEPVRALMAATELASYTMGNAIISNAVVDPRKALSILPKIQMLITGTSR